MSRAAAEKSQHAEGRERSMDDLPRGGSRRRRLGAVERGEGGAFDRQAPLQTPVDALRCCKEAADTDRQEQAIIIV
jgi:hypothetical protein